MGIDPARGREFVAAQIALVPADQVEVRDSWLASMDGAREMPATDDPHSDTAFLKVFLLEDRRPIVVFFNPIHEEDSRELLARLQVALDEELEVWSPGRSLKLKRSARS